MNEFIANRQVTQPSLFRPQSLWLIAPPIVLCCLDFGLTLYGQSDAYWNGNYSQIIEISPSFGKYLSVHPLAFVGAALLWIAIFSALIAILPEKAAMTMSICVVLGHMTGAASWLAYRFGSYQSCNALFVLTSIVIVCGFNLGRSENGRSLIDWKQTGMPAWTRWILVAMLVLLPIWWFLIPR